MSSSDVLASPAVEVLCRLEAEGLSFEVTPQGRFRVTPAQRLSSELAALVRQHRDDLVLLTHVCDRGVQARIDVFRRQIDAAPVGVVLPALLFRRGLAHERGRCFSCGDALERSRWGRCWRCALAWRLAARVPLTATASWGAKEMVIS